MNKNLKLDAEIITGSAVHQSDLMLLYLGKVQSSGTFFSFIGWLPFNCTKWRIIWGQLSFHGLIPQIIEVKPVITIEVLFRISRY